MTLIEEYEDEEEEIMELKNKIVFLEMDKENLKNELDKKDKIINKAIEEVEYLRQYFSEDCQADFIGILEILKDKNVIDW